MAPRSPDACGALLAIALAVNGAAAQTATTRFQTADGSHFVLIVDASIPQVHWAIATWADTAEEPAGCEGLATAIQRVSLNGTWRTGSLDATRERDALLQLDRSWQLLLRGSPEAPSAAALLAQNEAALALGDVTVFARVLAAAPSHRPEIAARGPTSVLTLTTLPAAIANVGRLLVERRDEQAFRLLSQVWLETFAERVQRHARDARNIVRAEVLALTMPDHGMARALDRPTPGRPTHDHVLAVWNATQRPERTVHVLLGDFEATLVRQTLEATFARTALPPHRPTPTPLPRPLTGTRRSTVVAAGPPSVTMAWSLPPGVDRFALATASRWWAEGPDSQLGQQLQRSGRKLAAVTCVAPWPPTTDGSSLLLIEVTDDGGLDGLADLLVNACRKVASTAPTDATLQPVTTSLQREWRAANGDPRALVAEIASQALVWPRQAITRDWPERTDPKAVLELLTKTFAGHPVIVEAKP